MEMASMEMVLMLGGVTLAAALVLVFFSNVYLELASRHARRRRLRRILQDGVSSRPQRNPLGLQELDACP